MVLILLWTFPLQQNRPPQVLKTKLILNRPNQQLPPNNCATKFSNLESNDAENDVNKYAKYQNSDEFALLVKDNSTPATEFRNVECDAIAKNGNPKIL